MPSVQRAYDDLEGDNLQFLLISLDTSAAPVESYMKENGFRFPVLLDVDAAVARKFGVAGTPTTFVIDRHGDIIAKATGPVEFDHPDFRSYLRTLLE